MDPDGRRTSTRAVLLAAAGQNCWPPAGSYMAATGQDLMAADIIVLDGYRTLAEQQALIDHYRAPSEFVASTSPDAMRPPHTTGAAVDLTLSWHGDPLAIGTDYDSFEPEAALEAFESGPDNVIRRLRRLLGITMMWAGFARYSPEWWHWSYGDDVWAAQKRCRTLYEVVELELSPQTS